MDAATLIRSCRRSAGLSQRQLAARSNTSPAAISLYEAGKRIPRVDTLTRIIAATGSTMTAIVEPPPAIDVEANGRDLLAVLALADHLPRRSAPEISAPVFAELARP